MKRLLAATALFCFLLPALHAGEFDDSLYYYQGDRPESLRAMEGKAAPSLKVKNWLGDAAAITTGKVVVVDFWATWCGPCVAAIPKNVKLHKTYADQGLVMIGVHDSKSGADRMKKMAETKGVEYASGVDDGSAKAWNVKFWPTYFVIDRKGIVRAAGLAPAHVETVVKTLLAEEAAPRPNVLVIMADDLGYADMSFLEQSPSDVATPHLDRFAKESVYFSNAYSTSPICSPSRCGMITGRYQQRWGNYWYGQGGLPKAERTLAHHLKDIGYRTAKVGKTHLNGGPAQHPLDHGFESFLGFIHHTWDYIRLDERDLAAYRERADGKALGILNVGPLDRDRGEKVSFENGFTTEIFTEETVKIIEAAEEDGRPFYIQLEHNAVHMPTYVAQPDYAKKAGYEQPVWDREAERWSYPFWDPRDITWKDWHKKWGHLGDVDPLGRKRYLANLMALDDSVGTVLAALEKTGQRKNTLVVFLSDNGGTINTYSDNTPLRGFKYMFGEGGVRVPMLVSLPERIPENIRRDALVSAMDIVPTVLDVVGVERPENLDGRSLLPVMKGDDKVGHDHLCWAKGAGTWSVRQGDWKLIKSDGWSHTNYRLDEERVAHPSDQISYPKGLLLFNLREDIGETTDVSAKHPERVSGMKAAYETWRSKMGKPVRAKKK